MIRSVLLFLVVTFGIHTELTAQQKDFATWNYLNFTYRLNENLNICLSEHYLRNENATESWLFIHDVSINQWLSPTFSHEFHVRFLQQKRLDNIFEDREVAYYALNYKLKLQDFNINFRSRWQGLAYGRHFNDAYKGPYFYHRFRISLGRRINYNWKIASNVELFQPLNRPQRAYIDQIRYGISLTNTINKHVSIDHFFQIQQQKNRKNPYQYFIYGIGCNFAL